MSVFPVSTAIDSDVLAGREGVTGRVLCSRTKREYLSLDSAKRSERDACTVASSPTRLTTNLLKLSILKKLSSWLFKVSRSSLRNANLASKRVFLYVTAASE